ncbi:acyl-CoA dehydrogenase [Sphingobium sp. SCG-1]|uniref:acyl-CoA dehydrogenase n=1 Tax=Sphingobium sp. SCG-1 TaxID=2072936 RepID=UPI000CD67AE5|nr:acyl-CoA dehydrogenase [Sphingobium sp. SCG-1]AUW60309.1 acyl-CoA dehydrogenase [Sphingobium sp. SCG-1]
MDMIELLEPFQRMLDAIATPSEVRAVEEGGDAGPMWQEFAESGFMDALVAEEHGGAGLTLADIEPLLQAIGAQPVPLPVAETMVARALLANAGIDRPDGPILMVTGSALPVPCAAAASHALVDDGEQLHLSPMEALSPVTTGAYHSLSMRLTDTPSGEKLARPAGGLRAIAAVLRAALIAGAAERLTQMSTQFANERVQFGKPIGRQQAVQHMLAVMGEDMIACRIAAQLGLSKGLDVPMPVAAAAKITTSAAVPRIAATAHAVHGAIGISEEYDLQLLTRRLHEWRLADGSEGYWEALLGAARLASPDPTVDWVRTEIFA